MRHALVYLLSALAPLINGCDQATKNCVPTPLATTYEVGPAAANDTSQGALERANACIQAKANQFAKSDDLGFARDAILSACQVQIQHAQATAYSSAVSSGISAPPPPGFTLHAPPCENGQAECKPWERAWGDTPPPVGTVVGRDGSSASPQHHTGEAMSDRVLNDLKNLAALRLTEAKLGNCKA